MGHRRRLDRPARGHRAAHRLRLRRTSRRSRLRRARIRRGHGVADSDPGGDLVVPVRRRMPVLRAVTQVRKRQQPARQARSDPAARRLARRERLTRSHVLRPEPKGRPCTDRYEIPPRVGGLAHDRARYLHPRHRRSGVPRRGVPRWRSGPDRSPPVHRQDHYRNRLPRWRRGPRTRGLRVVAAVGGAQASAAASPRDQGPPTAR